MPHIQAFQETADIDWLFETHLKAYAAMRAKTVVAVISGNEDCPVRVECFAWDIYRAKPFATFTQCELTGNLVQVFERTGWFVRSIHGELDSNEHDMERSTGRDAWGVIGEYVQGSNAYSVAFPNGTSVFITEDELSERANYRLATPMDVAAILIQHKAY